MTSGIERLTAGAVWGAAAALFLIVIGRDALPGPALALAALALFAAGIRWGAARREAARAEAAAAEKPRPSPAAERAALGAPEPAAAPPGAPEAAAPATRPPAAAAEAPADDLKRIRGVGPKIETLLHQLGVKRFDQIATWSEQELAWVDEHLEGFKGRATRDDWISQARALALGEKTAPERREAAPAEARP